MAHVTFTLTKHAQPGSQEQRVTTQADLSADELAALLKNLQENGTPEVGEFATIYVEPTEYTLSVNGKSLPLKPQFFPPEYGYIIDKLMQDLK